MCLFLQLDQTKRRHSLKLWVIDMLCLANINLMAIASTERDIGQYGGSPPALDVRDDICYAGTGSEAGRTARVGFLIHRRMNA